MNTTTRTNLFAILAIGALLAAWLPASASQVQPASQQPTGITAVPSPAPVPAPTPFPISLVKLSAAASANSYPMGTPIGIAATLTNRSGGPLGLSGIVDGNLVITSVTRDGARVATVPTMTNYLNGFPAALSDSLASVPAGGSLSMTWTSDFNQSLGGEALLGTVFTGAAIGSSTYYDLSLPGTYTITFHYRYKGPTSSFPGTVFRGKTNSVKVTFNVV